MKSGQREEKRVWTRVRKGADEIRGTVVASVPWGLLSYVRNGPEKPMMASSHPFNSISHVLSNETRRGSTHASPRIMTRRTTTTNNE